jgi:XRE family transcriptional regulator, aerobic/anaerobic benzoate catabolism transcriptional regulator
MLDQTTGSNPTTGEPRAPRGPLPESDALLRAIGSRLRLIRTQRGMTRRLLSGRSGVSERYIAQVEAGRGNGSVLLLHALASALAVSVVKLLEDPLEQNTLGARLARVAARLTPAEAEQAVGWLEERFLGAAASVRRHRRISLVGLRGAGKTSLGRLLAERLHVPFFELDQEIAREAAVDLSELFDRHGQAGYRRLQQQVLERLLHEGDAAVIATSGSIVAEPATYELLLQHCLTVWVRTSPEEHMQRVLGQSDLRPIHDSTQALDELRAILASREELYRRADLHLDTGGRTLPDSLLDLLQLLGQPG